MEALFGWSKKGEGKQRGEENGSENVVFPVWFRKENLRERKLGRKHITWDHKNSSLRIGKKTEERKSSNPEMTHIPLKV